MCRAIQALLQVAASVSLTLWCIVRVVDARPAETARLKTEPCGPESSLELCCPLPCTDKPWCLGEKGCFYMMFLPAIFDQDVYCIPREVGATVADLLERLQPLLTWYLGGKRAFSVGVTLSNRHCASVDVGSTSQWRKLLSQVSLGDVLALTITAETLRYGPHRSQAGIYVYSVDGNFNGFYPWRNVTVEELRERIRRVGLDQPRFAVAIADAREGKCAYRFGGSEVQDPKFVVPNYSLVLLQDANWPTRGVLLAGEVLNGGWWSVDMIRLVKQLQERAWLLPAASYSLMALDPDNQCMLDSSATMIAAARCGRVVSEDDAFCKTYGKGVPEHCHPRVLFVPPRTQNCPAWAAERQPASLPQ